MAATFPNNKYDKSTRRKIRSRIKALHKLGHTYEGMVSILSAEGFKTPNGGDITGQCISSQGQMSGIRKNSKRSSREVTYSDAAPAKSVNAKKDDTQVLADLILDASLSAEKKVALLRSLRQGR